MNPFLAFHRKSGDGIEVEVCVFHSHAANLSAIVGGEIIGQGLCIHARGVNGAELPFVGAEKPVGLIDGAHKMEKSRESGRLFLRGDSVGLGVDGASKSRG